MNRSYATQMAEAHSLVHELIMLSVEEFGCANELMPIGTAELTDNKQCLALKFEFAHIEPKLGEIVEQLTKDLSSIDKDMKTYVYGHNKIINIDLWRPEYDPPE